MVLKFGTEDSIKVPWAFADFYFATPVLDGDVAVLQLAQRLAPTCGSSLGPGFRSSIVAGHRSR